LRESSCSGGIIAGVFNSTFRGDHEVVEKNGLVDAWPALHGTSSLDGATWNVGVTQRNGAGSHRLDKIAMLGVKAEEMELLIPGCIEVPRDGEGPVEIPWSDHRGLRCTISF
jgi:tyrosyl-DNA phosphodiesterase 2